MTPPDRQGSFTNVAIWTSTLVAIAALTVWKFEIWPIASLTTNTGRIDTKAVDAESIAVDPIMVAGPNSSKKSAPATEKVDSGSDEAPPPPALAKLDLAGALPPIPEPETADWSQEPPPLPSAGDTETLPTEKVSTQAPECLPTGADFGGTGLFPEAKRAPSVPEGSVSPQPTAEPKLQPVSQEMEPAPKSDNPFLGPIAATNSGDSGTPVDPAKFETEATETDPRLAVVDEEIAANRYLAAHRVLSELYWDEPQLRPRIQDRIDQTAQSIYFDAQPHYMPAYEIAAGERLSKVAKTYRVPVEYLVRLNDIDDPAQPRAGKPLKVITGPFGAVIDLSENTLTLHAHGYYVREFPCKIATTDSPVSGTFHVHSEDQGRIILDDGHGHPSSRGIEGSDLASADAPEPGTIRLAKEDVVIVGDLLAAGCEISIRE